MDGSDTYGSDIQHYIIDPMIHSYDFIHCLDVIKHPDFIMAWKYKVKPDYEFSGNPMNNEEFRKFNIHEPSGKIRITVVLKKMKWNKRRIKDIYRLPRASHFFIEHQWVPWSTDVIHRISIAPKNMLTSFGRYPNNPTY